MTILISNIGDPVYHQVPTFFFLAVSKIPGKLCVTLFMVILTSGLIVKIVMMKLFGNDGSQVVIVLIMMMTMIGMATLSCAFQVSSVTADVRFQYLDSSAVPVKPKIGPTVIQNKTRAVQDYDEM